MVRQKQFTKHQKNKYIAALFDDVNSLIINKKEVLLYPHQIEKVTASTNIARVVNSYFKGAFWLISATYNGEVIYFNHPEGLEKNEQICLNFATKQPN
jgi:hypothetical protein